MGRWRRVGGGHRAASRAVMALGIERVDQHNRAKTARLQPLIGFSTVGVAF